jgi:hypothetical protein
MNFYKDTAPTIETNDGDKVNIISLTEAVVRLVDMNYNKNALHLTKDLIKQANSNMTWSGDSTVTKGVTITINDDMSLTFNGTVTAVFEFALYNRLDDILHLDPGTYVLSGIPYINDNTFIGCNRTVDGSGVRYGIQTGATPYTTFTVTDGTASMGVWIGVPNTTGTVFNNFTIKPMICYKEFYDVSPNYVP